MTKLQLPLAQFNSVSTVIQTTLSETRLVPEHYPTMSGSCVAFACLGAAIMNQTYGIKCQAVAGSYFLRHPDGEGLLAYSPGGPNLAATSLDGFHMWVQSETHIFDFLSPLYPECFARQAKLTGSPIERRMLQLSQDQDAEQFEDLNACKPLLTVPDPKMTEYLIDTFVGHPRIQDLYRLVLSWAPRVKKNPKAKAQILYDDGEVRTLSAVGKQARGIWLPPKKYHPIFESE